jgi:transketolase
MRSVLSDKIVGSAIQDSNFIVLSGDHGYALFDAIRKERPNQFINVGVAEQAMIGYSAGLAKTGFRPLVYGLSAFIPLRVLEQVKMDICYSSLPVIFLGDGAGLVYSTLGSSHQCAEDLACLRPLPHMTIYSPCDAIELATCFDEARSLNGPAYIRIGKSDRPVVNQKPLRSTQPHIVHSGNKRSRVRN